MEGVGKSGSIVFLDLRRYLRQIRMRKPCQEMLRRVAEPLGEARVPDERSQAFYIQLSRASGFEGLDAPAAPAVSPLGIT